MCRIANFSQVIILLLLLICSCESDEKPPVGTLSKEKMATILSEVHIAETRVTRLQLKSLDSSLMVFNQLKEGIWKKHKVDTLVYKNSYNYYMTHPEQMSGIYEMVEKKMNAREKTNNIRF
jgi:hypothetical protein